MSTHFMDDHQNNYFLTKMTLKYLYNLAHNIWEFYKVLVQFPVTKSKSELDITSR